MTNFQLSKADKLVQILLKGLPLSVFSWCSQKYHKTILDILGEVPPKQFSQPYVTRHELYIVKGVGVLHISMDGSVQNTYSVDMYINCAIKILNINLYINMV